MAVRWDAEAYWELFEVHGIDVVTMTPKPIQGPARVATLAPEPIPAPASRQEHTVSPETLKRVGWELEKHLNRVERSMNRWN